MALKETRNYDKINSPEEVLSEIDKEVYTSPKRNIARQKAQERGFADEYEMAGWLYFNRLNGSPIYNGYEVDVLNMTSSGEGFEY